MKIFTEELDFISVWSTYDETMAFPQNVIDNLFRYLSEYEATDKNPDYIFCNCNNKKLKKVFISNSLQYDFCENCKKEIK
jgi:hypothetical protein